MAVSNRLTHSYSLYHIIMNLSILGYLHNNCREKYAAQFELDFCTFQASLILVLSFMLSSYLWLSLARQ